MQVQPRAGELRSLQAAQRGQLRIRQGNQPDKGRGRRVRKEAKRSLTEKQALPLLMSFEDKTNRTLGMKSQEILQRQEDGETVTYGVKRAEWPSAKSAAEIKGES